MSTLARLSFWVPSDRMDGFEPAYRKKIVPILETHGLEESSERGRRPVEGVFSRLFEVETPTEVVAKERALGNDAAWQEMLQSLGTIFSTVKSDGLLRTSFGIYRTPVGSGRTMAAGLGRSARAGFGDRKGLWQSFDVSDGLPSPVIAGILQDREGDLWFASAHGGGITRYDGEQFLSFTIEDGLPDNSVWAVLEDQEGNLWTGTEGGVSRYDGKQFLIFTAEDGLADDHVRAIVEDSEGNLWFGTGSDERAGGGVSRYDGEQFITFTTEDGLGDNAVLSILADRGGVLWFGTSGGGVSRYDGEQFLTFTQEDGLADNTVCSILEDGEGHLWFGTGRFESGGGVSRYDGREFTTCAPVDGLVHNHVTSMLEDREGDLWFGTYGGVSRHDGKQFLTFTIRDGIAANWVTSMLEDQEGHLWFGTYGGGVSRYDGRQFLTFTTEDGLANNGVMSVMEDRKGDLWFATWEGVSRYDGKRLVTLEMLSDDNVSTVLEDREDNLWFGIRRGGVVKYDGEQLLPFTTEDGLAGNGVLSILEDRKGRLWFGTGGGVSQYDGERFVSLTVQDGLAEGHVESILEDREGYLWFVVPPARAASRYDGKEFVTFTPEEGLPNYNLVPVMEDREGYLWFGTWGGGVSRYDRSTGTEQQFVTFTAEDGLADNRVWSITQDREGYLWFGTWGGGASKYDGRVFQTLCKRDGLVSNTTHEILQDRNGDVWITTEGGVTRYRPGHTPPRIRITEVTADRRYGSTEEIRVPAYRQYVIAFEFQGRSLYTHWDRMAYVYRLEGYDEDWQVAYTGRVGYQDLPVGEYVFQVKAVDRDLNYSEPATVRIIVEPDPRLEGFADALSGTSQEFVGDSEALHRLEEQLVEVASTDITVLILGETGTGEGLSAQAIHGLSARKAGPFITVSCGTIPEALVESELFGHEKGAFTGAVSRKLGKVELAEGGTLFLDEIGDLPLASQVKLLRLLEERTLERVGSVETQHADVRIIAATNRELHRMVETGHFREDLYFRLRVFPVRMPALRERREDIPLLASYFVERMAAHLNKGVTQLSAEALATLQAYDWPGNVRELEHAMQRAVIVCPGTVIRIDDIALAPISVRGEPAEERVTPEEYERRYILEVLEQTGWVVRGPHGASAMLGMHEATLRYRMKKLGIRRNRA